MADFLQVPGYMHWFTDTVFITLSCQSSMITDKLSCTHFEYIGFLLKSEWDLIWSIKSLQKALLPTFDHQCLHTFVRSVQSLGMGVLFELQCNSGMGCHAFRVYAPRNGTNYQSLSNARTFFLSRNASKRTMSHWLSVCIHMLHVSFYE